MLPPIAAFLVPTSSCRQSDGQNAKKEEFAQVPSSFCKNTFDMNCSSEATLRDDRYVQSSNVNTERTMAKKPSLPVDALLPEIIESLKISTRLLLEASPGAGKTTRVPAALLKDGYEQIYVLEPRRLATRMAAQRVAEEMGQQVGATVGYQVRFEEVGSRETKLWYLTEGVLTRKLLSGSELPGVRVVILDEFHERHLETDLALALLLNLQQRRPDLKVVLMSATLAADTIRAQLGNPPLIQSPGRMFPVSVAYTPHSAAPLEAQVSAAVASALKQTKADILVFLPGAAEIRKAMQACEPVSRPFDAILCALHGDLSPEEQDRALKPAARRKIIFSTNVAESSVTIEGIESVIDSGVARVLTHSAWSGLSRLRVEKVSQASILQRSGRAGRTGPGTAIRLFPESDYLRRPAHIAPEIVRADFAPTLLQLIAANIPWQQLTWIDPPTAENVQPAHNLLVLMGALAEDQSVTPVGLQMARIPLHPRLARFLVAAADVGIAREATDLAARLSEPRFRPDDCAHHTFAGDLEAILAAEASYSVKQLRKQLSRLVRNTPAKTPDPHALEKALLLAYPDRVARKRGDTLLLANGGAAKLDHQSHASSDFVIALEIDDRSDQASALVRLAADIEPDWLLEAFPNEIQTAEELTWNREAERVEQRNVLRYRQIILDESSATPRNSTHATELLIAKAMETGVERFTDAEALMHFMQRIRFAAQHGNFEIPQDLFAQALRHLAGDAVSFAELRLAARDNAFLALLGFHLPMRVVDQIAPTHITLPSGRRAKIEYHEGRPPSVASRLQDFFGMQSTPTVAGGAVRLVVQLLAPNHRPVQVTTDLVSFWKNLYPQLRRELSRRYPRHSWPEIPA
jgi:ATP-dependent helicase HrpB